MTKECPNLNSAVVAWRLLCKVGWPKRPASRSSACRRLAFWLRSAWL